MKGLDWAQPVFLNSYIGTIFYIMNSAIPKSDRAKATLDGKPEGPRSPLRVMQALELLAAEPDGLSLARLAERLQTPKTSLLSLLRSLEAGGYVTQLGAQYQLGAKTMRLGALVASRATPDSSITARMHPLLREMMEQSGETTLLGVMGDDRRHGVYVDIVEGRGAIRFSSLIGTRRPLFCSAFGKILLAYQPQAEIDFYLDNTELVQPNGGRRMHKEEVLGILAAIRATGIGVSHEEIVDGAGGIGSPIFDRDGRNCGVLVVAAPISRLRSQHDRFSAMTHDYGERASRLLGFSGRYPGSK